MDVRILGPLEVNAEGRSVDLGGPRQRALFALLLLRRGEVVPADRLVEDLYGDRPPPTAAKSLQAHVSRLRKALANGRLVTRGPGYVLETAADEVDADRFARLLARGRGALQTGDAATAERLLTEALAQWRGTPLADLVYEAFAQAEIARLEELRLSCIEDLTEARLALGRDAELTAELELLVAQHPLRERLRGQLMLALYRAGRQADALAAYQDGRQRLVEELGIDPGRPLQDLERAVLNHDPALDVAPRRERSVTGRNEPPEIGGAFVGRARELAELEGLLDDVLAGNGRLAVVYGEAGIGKTRLTEELTARARRRGFRALSGRSWEAGGAPAFWPWVQALRAHVRETSSDELTEQLGNGAAELAQLLPELRDLFADLPEATTPESDGARFRLFDSTAAFLARAARKQPLLVTLDDLHAADTSSLLLLSFLAGHLGADRLAIVATYRDMELDVDDPARATLAGIARRASVRLALRGLGATEVAAYIRDVARADASDALVSAIAAETEGNPLFVGEIVRLLATEGRLAEPTGANWRPTVPETVREVIHRRLMRLTPGCRETLAVASVIGRDFSPVALEAISQVPRNDLVDLLDEAIAARVIAESAPSGGELRFIHALVRDTLYDELPAGDRRDLHRRAAETISRVGAPGAMGHHSELAHHYFHALPAVDPALAVESSRRAGDHARELLAYEEAARLYENALQALSAWGTSNPDIERALFLVLGDAYTGAADTRRAKDAYLRAAVAARECGAVGDLAAAALGYGGPLVWARPGGDPLVVALLEEALAALAPDAVVVRARLLARLAGALRDERDPRRRLEVGELAVESARAAGDTTALVQALLGLSVAQYGSEDHSGRLRVLRELRRLARETRDVGAECEALNAEIVLSSAVNDFASVRAHVDRLAERAAAHGQPAARWFASSMRALLALHSGDLEEAEHYVLAAYADGKDPYPKDAWAAYIIQLYLLRREQGRASEVHDALAETRDANPPRPFFACALAALCVETGRAAEARRILEELAPNRFEIVPRDNEWPLSAAFLVEVCRALGDTRRAATLYDELEPLAERSSANPPEGTIGAIARALGALAALLGRQADAEAHFRRAIEIDTATGARPWRAYAELELAEVLEDDGRNQETQSLRANAAATASELGLLRLLERVGVATG
jgi:DNA-binding SARP family transcriptional activator